MPAQWMTQKQLDIVVDLVLEERNAIRHMLLEETDEVDDEDRQEMIERYNELSQAFDLEQWES